jgi:HPt (histidine-containing phosphotransfer) domain-containing protein
MTINLDYLKELSGGDTEFENTIIRQFIVQVPEELELLKEAIAVRNNQKIKSIAHGMKSSVSYLGLSDIVYQNLHRMEVEAVKDEADNHFDEDYEIISSVCNQA